MYTDPIMHNARQMVAENVCGTLCLGPLFEFSWLFISAFYLLRWLSNYRHPRRTSADEPVVSVFNILFINLSRCERCNETLFFFQTLLMKTG